MSRTIREKPNADSPELTRTLSVFNETKLPEHYIIAEQEDKHVQY